MKLIQSNCGMYISYDSLVSGSYLFLKGRKLSVGITKDWRIENPVTKTSQYACVSYNIYHFSPNRNVIFVWAEK